jgi:hypothetical protein
MLNSWKLPKKFQDHWKFKIVIIAIKLSVSKFQTQTNLQFGHVM